MLSINFVNDKTGTLENANYKIDVRVNNVIIYSDILKGHDRTTGWKELLIQYAKKLKGERNGRIQQNKKEKKETD